jgi:putative ABC transport system permease protein
MLIVLLESILLALGGGLLGWMAGHALVAAASPWLEAQTGVSIGAFDFAPGLNLAEIFGGDPAANLNVSSELLLIPALMLLAVLVGFLPALSAYKTDVGDVLSSTP